MKNLEDKIKIIEFISSAPSITQRGLVRALGMSLGKVNFLLKQLDDTGMVRIRHCKNRGRSSRGRYVVTEKWKDLRDAMLSECLNLKIRDFEKLRNEIESLKAHLSETMVREVPVVKSNDASLGDRAPEHLIITYSEQRGHQ